MNQKSGLNKFEKTQYIDYESHEGLNEVTKQSIRLFEQSYLYEDFLADKASKDNKFPQTQQQKEEEAKEKEEKGGDGEGSEFSLSGAESDLERTMESWDRSKAEEMYRKMEEDLQGHQLL